ncbi:MAG: type II toxin-antitoxin system VapC family toxin [Cytophagales bacterium]|nr:type II toxin-antitoxin system VapC family toxin [Cytophagales bacterium]
MDGHNAETRYVETLHATSLHTSSLHSLGLSIDHAVIKGRQSSDGSIASGVEPSGEYAGKANATVNRIDVLISWNFRHIVNLNKIRLFNSVNLKLGLPQIDIRTLKELINYED